MDCIHKSTSTLTYAEVLSQPPLVYQEKIPPREEGIRVELRHNHPWLESHIPNGLRGRRDLTLIETGYSLENPPEVIPPEFSIKGILPNIEIDLTSSMHDRRIIKRRIYRLSLTESGRDFVTYLNGISPKTVLTVRKVHEYVQMIITPQGRRAIDENRLPLEWIPREKRERCDAILRKIFDQRKIFLIDHHHPQKKQIEETIVHLTMRPQGQDLLLKIEEVVLGKGSIRIAYKKGKNQLGGVQKISQVKVFIDSSSQDLCSLNSDGKYEAVPSSREATFGHELLHVLRVFKRLEVLPQEKEEMEKKILAEARFSPVLKAYEYAINYEFYGGFSSGFHRLEEQEVIIGGEKDPVTENGIRFCDFNGLRVNHFIMDERFQGQVFAGYTKESGAFGFFGQALFEGLEVAILKEDREAMHTLLNRITEKEVADALQRRVSNLAKMSFTQRLIFYEAMEMGFTRFRPEVADYPDLLHLPLRCIPLLLQVADLGGGELARFSYLLNCKGFFKKRIYLVQGSLRELETRLSDGMEKRRVHQLVQIAKKYAADHKGS